MTGTSMNIETAKSKITSHQATIAAKKAEMDAKVAADKAAAEAEKAYNEELSEAVGVQKFFKRPRTGQDAIGDETVLSEFIRCDERLKGGTGYNTTGISSVLGVKRQNYTLATLSGLELSSPSEFNAEKAKIESASSAG
jgi:hypothetical protein